MTATEASNTVKISDAGPSRKKISIEIPAETVTEKIRESMDTLAFEAALPGFRKGRVPRALIEKRFGATIRQEAKNQLVAEAYSRAVEENELKVLGDPTSESLGDLELVEGQGLSFDVEVEVLPEFDLPAYEGLAIKKPAIEITDEAVNQEVEKITINEGSLEELDAPAVGDYLTGHGVMTTGDGTEIHNIDGCVVRVPDEAKGMILGIVVDDLQKQLGLPKVGDEVKITCKGPEHHEVEEVRNADLTVVFNVKRIDRIIPATIEDIVSQYGMESEDDLRSRITERLEQASKARQQAAMRKQVADHLIEHTEIELPERVTASQAARILHRRRMELMYRGVDEAQIEQHIAELRAASSAMATRELKLFFILTRIGQELNVSITEQEVNGRIVQLAMQNGMRPEEMRQRLMQQNQIQQIAQQIREHKT
ncbi:MAG: trigger factor, partial [Phycisphaerales bacterium]|nr:trigger factor [Phycisphaerales bacterium]